MRQSLSVTVQDYLKDPSQYNAVLDVRSPAEFALDHLPGASSAAVLDDAERALIGTLSKEAGSFEAKKKGAALVAKNIASLLQAGLDHHPMSWKPLVYCWRGGQRSNSLATVLARIGWRASVLEGGYKAFRGAMVAELDDLPKRLSFKVLCGRTGTGKSLLLEELAKAGHQVLDLEALANHRGSVLGGIPNVPQPAQKAFENKVWWALRHFDHFRPVYVESESKKVGALHVPETLIQTMRASPCIEVHASVPTRVALLNDGYSHFLEGDAGTQALFAQLDCLVALHGHETIDAWKALASQKQWDSLVSDLLVNHYDPSYERAMDRNYIQRPSARRVELKEYSPLALAALAREIAQS